MVPFAQPMKILTGAILALAAAFARPAPAELWHVPGGGPLNVQAQRLRPDGLQRQSEPQRNFRRNERAPERGQRDGGWLTEDERRELRRDIDRADREIYKGRPHRQPEFPHQPPRDRK